jgi:hypothetical protein
MTLQPILGAHNYPFTLKQQKLTLSTCSVVQGGSSYKQGMYATFPRSEAGIEYVQSANKHDSASD